MPAQHVVLTEHARRQALRRGLVDELVIQVASRPEQILPSGRGREVRQSRVSMGRTYLVRVIADLAGQDIQVVTVYRTSKVSKYWRTP
jgi:hypothetical protein